ncbi:MAG: sulfite exporter TauE/SafE family protein [Flavobacteriales bacterium]
MELSLILGFVGAFLIGLTLGLIGGGGSILTVPLLVYLLDMDPVKATGYSLFIVGLTSAFGAARHLMLDQCKLKAGLYFAIPSTLSVFLTRSYLLPSLPNPLMVAGSMQLDKGDFLMTLFAALMLGTSWSMIRGGGKEQGKARGQDAPQYFLVGLGGLLVGVLAGMVGAGGGFLIVPALILLTRSSMKEAVGTSLFVIAIQSLLGFLGELGNENTTIEFDFLLTFSAFAVLGALIGVYGSRSIKSERLKPIFGSFVLLMAIGILIAEWTGLSGI